MSNTKKLSKSAVQELANLLLASVEGESYEDSVELVEGCDCECTKKTTLSVDEGSKLSDVQYNHSVAATILKIIEQHAGDIGTTCEDLDQTLASLENCPLSDLLERLEELQVLVQDLGEKADEIQDAVSNAFENLDEGDFLLNELAGSEESE
jgi:hypothetical protein